MGPSKGLPSSREMEVILYKHWSCKDRSDNCKTKFCGLQRQRKNASWRTFKRHVNGTWEDSRHYPGGDEVRGKVKCIQSGGNRRGKHSWWTKQQLSAPLGGRVGCTIGGTDVLRGWEQIPQAPKWEAGNLEFLQETVGAQTSLSIWMTWREYISFVQSFLF